MLFLLAAAVNGVIDCGESTEVCTACAARSEGRFLYVLGMGGTYKREITGGPISTFIEAQEGRPCEHSWSLCAQTSGNFLYRVYQPEDLKMETLYSLMQATNLDLAKRQEQDGAFLGQLKNAIKRPWRKENDALIAQLVSDAVQEFARPRGPEAP